MFPAHRRLARLRFVGWLAVVGILPFRGITQPGAPTGAVSPPGRNIVLIVADDLGLDLGCYGQSAARTPSLDRLASDGTRFTHAFCTTASCSPSRSVLLTGLHNHANGMYGLSHATHHFAAYDNLETLPARLREAGYRTARIGKFHVAPEATFRFDVVLGGNPGGDRNGVTMADRCREFLRDSRNTPFFLYFCSSDPHRSGTVNSNSPARPDRFGNDRSYDGVTERTFDPDSLPVPAYLPDTPAARAELAEYYQSVHRFDQGVGRLLEILDATGHRDDTLVVVLSDNGPAFPGAKTGLYEPGVRLPLLVRAPNQKRRGVVSQAMVSWVDITPTLLDFAGVRTEPQAFHGRSFLSILEQEDPPGWDEINASHTFHEVTMYYPMRLIRTRQFKLIENLAHPLEYPFASDLWESATWQTTLTTRATTYGRRAVSAFLHRPRWELYDLQADPDEIHNLADQPASQSTLVDLQARLRRFQETTRDPWLIKVKHE